MKKLNEYMTIKQAAEFLGVTTTTLRSWDKRKIIKCFRSLGGERRYLKEDLVDALKRVADSVNIK